MRMAVVDSSFQPPATTTSPRRHWRTFTLRTLFVAFTFGCLILAGLAAYLERGARRARAVKFFDEISASYHSIGPSYCFSTGSIFADHNRPFSVCGIEVVHCVNFVHCDYDIPATEKERREFWRHLGNLP